MAVATAARIEARRVHTSAPAEPVIRSASPQREQAEQDRYGACSQRQQQRP